MSAPAGEPASPVTEADGYAGPAVIIADGVSVQVLVELRGQFDPIGGRYHWYGRVAASPELAALVAGGAGPVVLRTPHAEVATTLADVDPWGRARVEGFGASPFAVLTTVPME